MTVIGSFTRYRQERKTDVCNAKALADESVHTFWERLSNEEDVVRSDYDRSFVLILLDRTEEFPHSLKSDFGRRTRVERCVTGNIYRQLTSKGVNATSTQLFWDWLDPNQNDEVLITVQIWFKPEAA